MAIKLGGGGGGGAQIDEIGVFVEQGSLFTDSNDAVWLKKGDRTLAVTTYPDAIAQNAAVSNATDFQSVQVMGSTSPQHLGVSSDTLWAMSSFTYNSRQFCLLDIATDTVTNSLYWPNNSSTTYVYSLGYIKCNASSGVDSNISNANNYFGVALCNNSSGTQITLRPATLTGGSGTDAGKPITHKNPIYLKDTSGAQIGGLGRYYATGTAASGFHWNPVSRKLYVMFGSGTTRFELYVYDYSSKTFGHTSADGHDNGLAASQNIDWHAQAGAGADEVYTMSGDATHLYVDYSIVDNLQYEGSSSRKIRKIPMSGNLSWSSGTDLAGAIIDPASGQRILKHSSTNVAIATSIRGGAIYYKTVSSTPKFLLLDIAKKVTEFAINVPVIGEPAPDYRHAKTQYQRIK